MKKHTPPQRHTRILYLPIEPHEAVAEVSKGKAYIIQKKVAPLENVCVCDMFQPFALRATLFGHAVERHERRLQSQVAKSYDLRLISLLGTPSTQPAKTCDNCRDIGSKVL